MSNASGLPKVVRQIEQQPPALGEVLEVAPNIFWLRIPLPMKLDHINLYLLDEGDSWALIDTGMNTQDARDTWEILFTNVLGDKPIGRVIVTHMHPDHVGLAGWICERFRCPMYMTALEYYAVRAYCGSSTMDWNLEQFVRRAGLGNDYIDYMRERMGFSDIVSQMPGSYIRLNHDDELTIAGRQWRVIVGAGHSIAHACLYCEDEALLLAGDQLLPAISPNVSVLPTEPQSSPLHPWFDSLNALHVLKAETLVMPAHNKPFTGVHQRAQEIIKHHEGQLSYLLSLCQSPQKPADLLQSLFGREIHFREMSLAIGECKAHLHMLMDRKLMCCELIDGVEYYTALVIRDDASAS